MQLAAAGGTAGVSGGQDKLHITNLTFKVNKNTAKSLIFVKQR
jgi:hypothetical protein